MSFEIEKVKARCAAARPGSRECDHESWAEIDDITVWADHRDEDGIRDECICNIGPPISECVENLQSLADGRFIAHARTDLPDAIELIEEAVRLLEKASDPYPVGSTWYRDQQAFLAKAGSTKKTP